MAGNADWVTASDVLVQGTATPGDFKDTNGAANAVQQQSVAVRATWFIYDNYFS